MRIESDFQVDRRVGIAMDALSPSQKAVLKSALQNKEQFLAYANRPGMTKKISASKPLYTLRAGSGMRIVFEAQSDSIIVRDLMRKATLERYLTKRKSKPRSTKKDAGKTP